MNKCKRFFQKHFLLKTFFLLHFTAVLTSMLLGRYYDTSPLIRYCTKYQTAFFTQTWKLFTSPPLEFTCYFKIQDAWMSSEFFLSNRVSFFKREALRLGLYNTIHYIITISSKEEVLVTLKNFFIKNHGELPDGICIFYRGKEFGPCEIWGFKKQNDYLWVVK